MVSMLRVVCLGFVFITSAHADIPYFKWQKDSVYRVVKTHGCKTANICVGMAERYYQGQIQGTEVVVCNSNGDSCPSADACREGTHELTTVAKPKLNDDGKRPWNPRPEWIEGAPKKISKTAGCATPNFCYGKYDNYWNGFAGSEKRSGGLAFCNADDDGNCKSITNCIADEDMMMDQHPDIAAKKRMGDGDGDNAKKKGVESDQT